MTIRTKAVYAHGVLKPLEPLPLSERQTVDLEITSPEPVGTAPRNDFASLYGAWKGSPDALEAELAAARRMTQERLDQMGRDLP